MINDNKYPSIHGYGIPSWDEVPPEHRENMDKIWNWMKYANSLDNLYPEKWPERVKKEELYK